MSSSPAAAAALVLASCEGLPTAGYRAIAVARKEGAELAKIIADGRNAEAIRFAPFDLGDVDGIPALGAGLRKQFGPLYGLVNNAAVGTDGALSLMHNSQIEQTGAAQYAVADRAHKIRGARHDGGTAAAASSMSPRSSASTGYSGLSVYAATKASMLGFTRSLAREVGRLGITVNAVAPGFLDTDMTHGLAGAQREQVVRRSALRRLAGVDDVPRRSFCSAIRRKASPGRR